MRYVSTRGGDATTGLAAVRRGLAPDGGLYVPEQFPDIDLAALAALPYPELAAAVMGPFLPELTGAELGRMTAAAYDRFDTAEVVPVVAAGPDHLLQLWHGPTAAFKDVALTLLPHLLTAARAHGDAAAGRSLVLTATSGDTGKAAMAGFAGVAGTEVVVLYPTDGVSHLQKLQMVTQAGDNVHVIGIRGSFDDAQRAVKHLLSDPAFAAVVNARRDEVTSANSINLGRLLPQVVYYVHGYRRLVQAGVLAWGDGVDVVVPTGNFGNILAADWARRLGLPVTRLVCAANANKVLADFVATGTYDANRDLVATSSPSMDIRVSSNLERFLWQLAGPAPVTAAMASLHERGRFAWDGLPDWLVAGWADEAAMAAALRRAWHEHGRLVDPHTAVALAVLEQVGRERPTLVAETASAHKFAPAVLGALGAPVPDDGLVAFDALVELTGLTPAQALVDLRHEPVRHHTVIDAGAITAAVREALGV